MKPLAIRLNTKEFTLAPVCCLHWPVGEQQLLREWVQAVRSRPHVYTILMGDSLDQVRTHYRRHLASYVEDENSKEAYDGYVREEVRRLAKELEPIKDRIWGSVCGNHYYDFEDGTNSEQYLCQLLGTRYLGAVAGIRVTMPANGNTSRTVKILAHHTGGSMGGRTTGGDVAALSRMEAGFDMDIYLAGHTHRRHGHKETALTLTEYGKEPKVVERTRLFARCGAFLKGFQEDHPTTTRRHVPSYAEQKLLRPTDLGWIEIAVKFRQVGSGTRAVTIPDYRLSY